MRKSSLQFCVDEIPWFDRDERPLLNEILDTMDEREGCVFLVLGSIQSFKSLVVQLKMIADLVLRPASAAWYGPNRDFTRSFAEEKLNALYDSLPVLRRIEPANQDRIKAMSKNLPHLLFRLLSAHTQGDRQSKTLQKIAMDEAWMYDPGELTEIRGRATSFSKTRDWQIYIPSSGFTAGDEGDELWRDSDQRCWHVDCPECGAGFYPDVYPPETVESVDEASGRPQVTQPPGGLMFDAGDASRDADGRLVERAFAETVFYECPACAARLVELPLGSSRFEALRPEPSSRQVVAWKWNALLHMPLAEVALLKAKADDALAHGDAYELEDFDRKRAVRPWSVASVVKRVDRPACLGAYSLGETWAEEYFRVMEIDVQIDHYYWAIRIWSRRTRSRLLALGIAWSEEQLAQIQREHGVQGHGGDIRSHATTGQLYFAQGCGVFIDGNYATSRVRQMAARHHWCVLRGEESGDRYPHPDGRSRIWNPIQAVEAFSGVAQSAGGSGPEPDRYVGEVRFRKNAARDTLRILQGQTASGMWTYAKDAATAHPEYPKHLSAWAPRDKLKRKGSLETVTEWVQTYERDDWEWCECASVIAASMTGLIGSDAAEGDAKSEKG